MSPRRRPPANPTLVMVLCVALAAALFAYVLYALWTNDPRHSIALAGLLVGPALLYFAYKTHRRSHAERERAARLQAALRSGELYTLLEPAQPASRLGSWWDGGGPYREVVGFTSMGSVFLRNPDDRTYVVLWPLRAGRNASSVGEYASLARFEADFIHDPDVAEYLLQPQTVAELRQAYGPLQRHQVYVPIPILMVLGGHAPSGYDPGDFWVFMELCGQTHEALTRA